MWQVSWDYLRQLSLALQMDFYILLHFAYKQEAIFFFTLINQADGWLLWSLRV